MKCAIKDTVTYIKLLAQDMVGWDPNNAVLTIMLDLKMPANHHGFEFLKTAILLQHTNPKLVVVNELYQIIAQTQGTTSEDIIATNIRSRHNPGTPADQRRGHRRSGADSGVLAGMRGCLSAAAVPGGGQQWQKINTRRIRCLPDPGRSCAACWHRSWKRVLPAQTMRWCGSCWHSCKAAARTRHFMTTRRWKPPAKNSGRTRSVR